MNEPAALPKSRFLDIGRQAEMLTFSFARCFEESLGLNLHRREAHRAAKSALKSLGAVTWLSADLVLILDGRRSAIDDMASVLNEIDQRLERIAERPLSARTVERTLSITARERSRWTKDGRLAAAGTSLIRRGQLVSLSTYAVGDVARLINEPETIRAWREPTTMVVVIGFTPSGKHFGSGTAIDRQFERIHLWRQASSFHQSCRSRTCLPRPGS
jgi:hypothetical protein